MLGLRWIRTSTRSVATPGEIKGFFFNEIGVPDRSGSFHCFVQLNEMHKPALGLCFMPMHLLTMIEVVNGSQSCEARDVSLLSILD